MLMTHQHLLRVLLAASAGRWLSVMIHYDNEVIHYGSDFHHNIVVSQHDFLHVLLAASAG